MGLAREVQPSDGVRKRSRWQFSGRHLQSEYDLQIDGLAQAFAFNYKDKEKRQIFAEIFAQRLPQLWIEKQPVKE